MRFLSLLGVLLVFPALAGCVAQNESGVSKSTVGETIIPDPTSPGPLSVSQLEYDFGTMTVSDPSGYTYPTRIRGSVHFPIEAGGPFPLVVFLHGMHATCRDLARGESYHVLICPDVPPVSEPVDSYKGYDYISEILGSQGYVVVSIDSSDVVSRSNDGFYYGSVLSGSDGGAHARAQLVLRTLDEFGRLDESAGPEPIGGRFVGRLDMERIGLMGHSRGGEGVVRASSLNANRVDDAHAIRAIFALAPTDFTETPVADDEALAVLLPSCDGDLVDLQGAWLFGRTWPQERSAPTVQLLAMGANHNWYNTVWTFDDAEWGEYTRNDPACGSEGGRHGLGSWRLPADDQRQQSLAYVAGFFRWRLGGEEAFLPVFTGHARFPSLPCPVTPRCPGKVLASYVAPSEDRRVLLRPEEGAGPLDASEGVRATSEGFEVLEVCGPYECPGAIWHSDPSYRLQLAWQEPARFALALDEEERDLRGFDALTLRVSVDPTDARNPRGLAQDFRIVLVDGAGRRAEAHARDHSDAVFYPPGVSAAKAVLNVVGVPLDAFRGVDQANVERIELLFDATPMGALHIADVMLQRGARLHTVPAEWIPRADSGEVDPSPREAACTAARGALGPRPAPVGRNCWLFFYAPVMLDRYGAVDLEMRWDSLPPGATGARLALGGDGCAPLDALDPCTLAEARATSPPVRLSLDADWLREHGGKYVYSVAYAEAAAEATFDVYARFTLLPPPDNAPRS